MAEFKDYLRAGPDFDDLDLTRAIEFPRDIDWTEPRERPGLAPNAVLDTPEDPRSG